MKKAKRISFLDCPHKNVQQFSECCMDCGYNIYMSNKEYEKILEEEAGPTHIRELEKKLDIGGDQEYSTGIW
jgi:hypothetical protein